MSERNAGDLARLEAAVAAARRAPEKVAAQVALAEALRQNDLPRALALAAEAERLARIARDLPGVAAASFQRAMCENLRGRYVAALTAGKQALALYRRLDDAAGAARTLHAIGIGYHNLSKYRIALAYFEKSLAANPAADAAWRSILLSLIGRARDLLGERTAAREAFTRALALARRAGAPLAELDACLSLGGLELEHGDPAAALPPLRRGLELATRARLAIRQADLLIYLGDAELKSGRPARAESFYRRALAIARRQQALIATGNALDGLGGAALARGDDAAALRHFGALHRLGGKPGRGYLRGMGAVGLARAHARNPRGRAKARAFAREALDAAAGTENAALTAEAGELLARLERPAARTT